MPRKPKRVSSAGTEYRFRIDAYTPETLPMARLAEYMAELSRLLGERDSVHFQKLARGSTVLVHRIEREALPKVRARIAHVRTGSAPTEAARAYESINRLLRADNAVGVLKDKEHRGVLIRFPGKEETQEEFEAVKQHGSVDGLVTWVGGSDDTAHITLETEGRQVSRIFTTRDIAKALAKHLFEPVRLHGRGRWSRDSEGLWRLVDFKAVSFEPLDDAPLSAVVDQLRAIPTEWDRDAYGELGTIRHGSEGTKRGRH